MLLYAILEPVKTGVGITSAGPLDIPCYEGDEMI